MSFTASGARRTGDEYQDLQSSEVLIQWLEQPDLYRWVRLEAMDGSLDDIQAQRSDGSLRLLQVKFATDATASWDWDELLETRTGARGQLRSLLQKWKAALDTAIAGGASIHEAAFYTNRSATNAILDHLTVDAFLEFDKLPAALQQRIASQLNGDTETAAFFRGFRFRFQERSPQALSSSLQHRFRQLGGTNDGWWSLLNNVRLWINRKDEPNPDGRILYADVLAAALWQLPPHIPENFAVPGDYVAPQRWSERLVLPRTVTSQSVLTVTGSPGAGKSTYLSWLVDRLRTEGQPVIRHHYFLSTTDPTPGRSSCETAAGSLIFQLRTGYAALVRSADADNPVPSKLPAYLAAAGVQRRGTSPLVVIIDGLDHVWRDTGNDDDLRRFFDLLLPAPEGVSIVVGTQDVDVVRLPRKLREASPRETWVTVPSLTREEVNAWLQHHAGDLRAVAEGEALARYLSEIAEAFYEVTSGHPLVLHYALSQIKSSRVVRADQVRALPRFAPGSNIADYYRGLFEELSVEGRQLLHLLAGFAWAWPRDGLIQCLAPQRDVGRLETAERAIHHLLGVGPIGVTAFHESLLAFIRGLPNHATTTESLRPGVLHWLASSAPEYWRWRYEWIEQRHNGNASPLIFGASFEWCIDALTSGRTRADILRVLSESGWAALDAGDFAIATQRHFLDERLDDAYTPDDVVARLLLLGLSRHRGQTANLELDIAASNIANASVADLAAMCELAARLRRFDICVKLLDECGSRWNMALSSSAGSQTFDSLKATFPFALAAALRLPSQSHCRATLKEDGDYPSWCEPGRYSRALGQLCVLADDSAAHRDELRFLANHPTVPVPEAADEIVRLACRDAFQPDGWFSSTESARAELFRSFKAMAGHETTFDSLPHVRSFAPAWDSSRFDDDQFVELARAFFFSCFGSAAMDGTTPEPSDVDPRADLVVSLLEELAQIAVTAVERCNAGERTGAAWFLEQVQTREHIEPPPNEYADRFARRATCSRVFISIALDLEALFHSITGNASLGPQTLAASISAGSTFAIDWARAIVQRRCPLSDAAAAETIADAARNSLATRIDYVSARAEEYVLLAQFSQLHQRPEANTKQLAQLAARHFFGHIFHKDMVLFDYLEALKDFSALDNQVLIESLRAAEPLVDVILDLTDGDETRHLRAELGEVLMHCAPGALPTYLRKLQRSYNHWQAEVLATKIARTLELTTPFEIGLASTLVHEEALEVWEQRAASGDNSASSVLNEIDSYVGRTRRTPKSAETPTSSGESMPAPLPQIDAYPPSKFSAYVDAVRAAHSFGSEHLAAWTRHWIERAPTELLEAFNGYVRGHDDVPETVSAQQIIGVALEHGGRAEAWRWMLHFHRSLYGWINFMYPLGQARAIWGVVRERFANQWLDFVRETSEPKWRRIKAAPSWSFHRIVLFLIEMGKLDDARAVVRAARELVLGLAVDMPLPAASIEIARAELPPTLRLLVERLDCPSRLVQDRAMSALADLLGGLETRSATLTALAGWHAAGADEMRTCLVLQLIWLASVRFSLNRTDCEELVNAFERVQSAGESIVLDMLGVTGGAARPVTPSPAASKPTLRFRDTVEGHLAPVFHHWASELDRRGLQFTRRWREEFEALATTLPIKVEEASRHFHYRGSTDAGFLEVNDHVSSLLRDAYLRVLQSLTDAGALAPNDALPHQLRVSMLMDPPFWTDPSASPAWWPSISLNDADPRRVDECVRRVLRDLESASRLSSQLLLCASGPLIALPTINIQLTIQTFLQSAVGTYKPATEDIAAVSRVTCRYDQDLDVRRTYAALEPCVGRLDDWILAPLAWLTVNSNVHPWLRPHLASRQPPLPADWLFEGRPSVTASRDAVSISDARGVLARRTYWNADLRGRLHYSEGPHAGFELIGERALVAPHMAAGADLCWVAFVHTMEREGHEKAFAPPTLTMSAVAGGSRMVWPTPWIPPTR
jgi:hypothetical protein